MKINQKQFNLLKDILDKYELKKNIYDLTTLEAAVAIEGILNNGQVKPFHNKIALTKEQFKKKQIFFENLVQKRDFKATEKQLRYINYLASKNNYMLLTGNIPKSNVNILIDFFEKNINSDIALKYIRKREIEEKKKLITIIKKEPEQSINLPKEWIIENIEINGIINF